MKLNCQTFCTVAKDIVQAYLAFIKCNEPFRPSHKK